VASSDDFDREFHVLEAELRKLEVEYNMFFAGQLPIPPWESRSRVQALIKRYDRVPLKNYADRFRLNTLQARFATFTDLWDRGLRAREEGRPGPFSQRQTPETGPRPADRILHVAVLADVKEEDDKIRELYDRLAEVRREIGEESVPFHRFAHLIRKQVQQLQQNGTEQVAFRLSLKDGKVNLTARALKGAGSG
jgi:hypothetical protein